MFAAAVAKAEAIAARVDELVVVADSVERASLPSERPRLHLRCGEPRWARCSFRNGDSRPSYERSSTLVSAIETRAASRSTRRLSQCVSRRTIGTRAGRSSGAASTA